MSSSLEYFAPGRVACKARPFLEIWYTHTHDNRGRPRIRSAFLTGLGCGVRLSASIPAGFDELCEGFLCLEHDHPLIFNPETQTGADRNQLHESVLFGFRVDSDARAVRRTQQQYVYAQIAEDGISGRRLDRPLSCRVKLIQIRQGLSRHFANLFPSFGW